MARKSDQFLESYNKAMDKFEKREFKSKTGKGGFYPAKKKLLLNEITKLNKIIKKDGNLVNPPSGNTKAVIAAKDRLLEKLDFVEDAMGLPEAKTPLSQETEMRMSKARGGKVYAMNRKMGGPIRKPRMM